MQIQAQNRNVEENTSDAKIKVVEAFMSNANCILIEYDDKPVRRVIQNINVVNEAKIEVVFKSGIVVEECIDFI